MFDEPPESKAPIPSDEEVLTALRALANEEPRSPKEIKFIAEVAHERLAAALIAMDLEKLFSEKDQDYAPFTPHEKTRLHHAVKQASMVPRAETRLLAANGRTIAQAMRYGYLHETGQLDEPEDEEVEIDLGAIR